MNLEKIAILFRISHYVILRLKIGASTLLYHPQNGVGNKEIKIDHILRWPLNSYATPLAAVVFVPVYVRFPNGEARVAKITPNR